MKNLFLTSFLKIVVLQGENVIDTRAPVTKRLPTLALAIIFLSSPLERLCINTIAKHELFKYQISLSEHRLLLPSQAQIS